MLNKKKDMYFVGFSSVIWEIMFFAWKFFFFLCFGLWIRIQLCVDIFSVLRDKCACAVSKRKMCSLVITVLATKYIIIIIIIWTFYFGKEIFDCLCTIGLGQQSHSERKIERKLVESKNGTVRHVDQTIVAINRNIVCHS